MESTLFVRFLGCCFLFFSFFLFCFGLFWGFFHQKPMALRPSYSTEENLPEERQTFIPKG